MKKLKVFFVLSLFFFSTIVLFKYCTDFQESKIAKLQAKIDQLKSETVPMKFVILERSNGNIKFIVKFLNTKGENIAKDTMMLKGSELSFDFYSIPISSDHFIAFPYKIFTDEIAPKDGILLFDYYDNNNFPEIYKDDKMDKDVKEGLTVLFGLLKQGRETEIEGNFGNMVHDLKNIRQFRTDEVYKIVSRTKGGIEVMRD